MKRNSWFHTIMAMTFLIVTSAQPSFARPQKDHYKLAILGSGPGGLTTALAALQAGLSPSDIYIAEKRNKENWASRERVIVLDGQSVRALQALGVKLRGTKPDWLVAHTGAGQRGYFPFSGPWKAATEGLLGPREFGMLISIGDLETSLYDRLRASGVSIDFGSEVVAEQGQVKSKSVDSEGAFALTADHIVVASGAGKSEFEQGLRTTVAPETTSNYIATDYVTDRNFAAMPGEMHSIFYDRLQSPRGPVSVTVYGFIGPTNSSVNLMLPPGLDSDEVKNDPSMRAFYEGVVVHAAKRFGVNSDKVVRVTYYKGQMSMRRSVVDGNTIYCGESARNVDPIAGTGANAAIADALSVGQYVSQRDSGRAVRPTERLISQLRDHTTYAFEFSLFFREVAKKARQEPGWIGLMVKAGLSSRGSQQGVIDLGKNLTAAYVGAADLFWGMAGSMVGLKVTPVQTTMNLGTAAFGGPKPPFKSPERLALVGLPHPDSDPRPAPLRSCRDLFLRSGALVARPK